MSDVLVDPTDRCRGLVVVADVTHELARKIFYRSEDVYEITGHKSGKNPDEKTNDPAETIITNINVEKLVSVEFLIYVPDAIYGSIDSNPSCIREGWNRCCQKAWIYRMKSGSDYVTKLTTNFGRL